jgi:hypothetical protein
LSNVGPQRLAPRVAWFSDQPQPSRSPPRGRSGRQSMWRQRNDKHEQPDGCTASCGQYLAAHAENNSELRRAPCAIQSGRSRLSAGRILWPCRRRIQMLPWTSTVETGALKDDYPTRAERISAKGHMGRSSVARRGLAPQHRRCGLASIGRKRIGENASWPHPPPFTQFGQARREAGLIPNRC